MRDKIYTYPYSQDYHPSMPVVEISLSKPGNNEAKELLTALIDSGCSDGTLIPIDVLEEVGARHVGEARLRGILGNRRSVDVYLVSLRIGPNPVHAARAVAVPEGDEIILGRNVLNHLVITLNGPASVIEIPA
jgi:predicted aspartyl protease